MSSLINGVRALEPAFDVGQANEAIAAVEGARLLSPLWSDLSRVPLRPLSLELQSPFLTIDANIVPLA